jgi:aspartate 1-decarboxylase
VQKTILSGKIHRATVTEANINYVGSITIDADLMSAAGFDEYEKVAVVDVDNGHRLETYIIAGEKGSGIICLNGAAARLVDVQDKVIIMSYVSLTKKQLKKHKPKVVFVDDANFPIRVTNYETHGELA